MALRFAPESEPQETSHATQGPVGADIDKRDASKIAGGDDFGSFDGFGGDFGFGGSDPFSLGGSDPFGMGGGSLDIGGDPFGAGGDPFGTGSDHGAGDPFQTGDALFDPFHSGDPFTVDTGALAGTGTGDAYDATPFVGPLPSDDHGAAPPVGADADGLHLSTETPHLDDGGGFVGPLPPDDHTGDDHAPADVHVSDEHSGDEHTDADHLAVDAHVSDEHSGDAHTDADHLPADGHVSDLHSGDDHAAGSGTTDSHVDDGSTSHAETHAETDQGAHDFDLDPDHHAGVSEVTTDDAGHVVTHFADGSSLTTDHDGNVVSFTEPPHDGTTTSAATEPGHTAASGDTHLTGADASHADSYGPDFVGPIPTGGNHDDIPVVPPLVLAHGDADNHVDVASHTTDDTSGHTQDDVVHATGDAHQGIVSSELDHESGNTVTHFADGSSLTTDHDGNVVAFSEHSDPNDPTHPGTTTDDGHVTTGADHPADNHTETNSDHGPTVGATGPGGTSTVTDATLLQNSNLGSCFVDASLIGAGSYVNGLVHDNGNGTYTVTLTSRTGNTFDVTVTPTTTPYGASPNGTDAQTAGNMQIVEQAIGVARDDGANHAPGEIHDYDGIANGGVVSGVLAQIGLTDLHSTWQSDTTITGYTVTSAFEAGNVVVVSTTKDTSNPSLEAWGITPGHALAVTGVTQDPATGLTLVTFTDSNNGTKVVVPEAVLGNGVLVDVSWGRVPGAPTPTNDFGPGDHVNTTPTNLENVPSNPGEYGPGDRPANEEGTSSDSPDTSYTYTYGDVATADGGDPFGDIGGGGGYIG